MYKLKKDSGPKLFMYKILTAFVIVSISSCVPLSPPNPMPSTSSRLESESSEAKSKQLNCEGTESIPYPAPGSSMNLPKDLVQGIPYLKIHEYNACENTTLNVQAFEFTPGTCTSLTLQNREGTVKKSLGSATVAGSRQVSFGFDTSPYQRGIYTISLQNADGSEQVSKEVPILPCENLPTPSPFIPNTDQTPAPLSENIYLDLEPKEICVGEEATISLSLDKAQTYSVYLERPKPIEGKVPPLYGEHVLLTELQVLQNKPLTYRFKVDEIIKDFKNPEKSLSIKLGTHLVYLVSSVETIGAGALFVKNCSEDTNK